MPIVDPGHEYRARADARRQQAARWRRRSDVIGNLRLVVFAAGIVFLWATLSHQSLLPLWSLLFPVAAFLALIAWHDAVDRRKRGREKAIAFYERGIARIEDRWHGAGATGDRFRVPDHVFADDLDLFGEDSLFQLLSTARTPLGEATLAGWLLAPSAPADILARQQAVAELRERLDFREDLAVIGEDAAAQGDAENLLRWAETPPALTSAGMRVLAAVLMLSAIASAVIGLWSGLWAPLVVVIAFEAVVQWRCRKRFELVVDPVSGAAGELALASELLARMERERFDSARLAALGRGLDASGNAPSRSIRSLKTLVNWVDSRHHFLLRAFDVPLLYSLQVAFAVDSWRRAHGRSVRGWLEALGEMEAIAALAAYSYEHPADPFPEFSEGPKPLFAGEDLGHPLLAAGKNVRNSVDLGQATQVLLVSGSNMSGKSTYLRTAGVNAVLALAGAPVRARSLRLTALRLGASIRVTDSLQAGRSAFFAEVMRLRQIMDLAPGGAGVLFLCDELLHGTNSHDRRIGAEGLVRALLERGAIGIVTTHDLALTAIANDARVRNAHFEDELRDGHMVFDYRLHDGVVTKSNALELMRSVGLDV